MLMGTAPSSSEDLAALVTLCAARYMQPLAAPSSQNTIWLQAFRYHTTSGEIARGCSCAEGRTNSLRAAAVVPRETIVQSLQHTTCSLLPHEVLDHTVAALVGANPHAAAWLLRCGRIAEACINALQSNS